MADNPCTYVTPKSPRQAVQNALVEIEAEEQKHGVKLSHDLQAEIIVHHIRDYDGGKITLAMIKSLTLDEMKEAIKSIFGWEDNK